MSAAGEGPDREQSAPLSPSTRPSGYHPSFKETRHG